MNIYDFIDSKDIREHNSKLETPFTVLTQAALIYHSRLKSVEEKLSAWHELLNTATELQFKFIVPPSRGVINRSNRELVENIVRIYESALDRVDHNENNIFEACLYECD